MTATVTGVASSRVLALAATAIALLALAATRIGFASYEFRYSLLVLLAGAVVTALGLWTWRGIPESRVGPLLGACAAAWFLPGLRYVAWPPLAEAAGALTLLWVAVLGHAALTWPEGRARPTAVLLLVIALYVAALAPVAEPSLLVGAVLAAGLALTVIGRDAADRRAHAPAIVAGLLLALAVAVRPDLPAVSVAGALLDTRPLDQVALMACAGILAAVLQRRTVAATRLSDLVVELGRAPGGELSRQLGAALRDPTLAIGFRVADGPGYVDPSGRPTELPAPGSGRAVEHLAGEAGPVAILVHDTEVAIDPTVLAAIGRGAALWTANATLQAELRAQVAELRASRDRLATAADQERAGLARDLHTATDPDLSALEAHLRDARSDPSADVDALIDEIREIRQDLDDLAEGLRPRLLGELGLAGALEVLVGRSAVPVASRIRLDVDPDPAVAAGLLFVAAESLTNVARHAAASRVSLDLDAGAAGIRLEIADDGRGGADPARGSGLAGLRERVEGLGGRITVGDRQPAGTRIVVQLPSRSDRLALPETGG